MTIYVERAMVPVRCDTATERAEIMEMLNALAIEYKIHEYIADTGIKYCLDVYMNSVVMKP